MNPHKELIDRLKDLAHNAQFVSFRYVAKETGEQARHTLIVGVSYDEQIRKSITALEILAPTLQLDIEKQAAAALLKSYEKSLASHAVGEYHPDYKCKESYVNITQNLKYCLSTGKIHVSGLKQTKVVIVPGTYKVVNQRPLTIAKDKLTEGLPIGRWRQFILDPENVQVAKLQGVTLDLTGELV